MTSPGEPTTSIDLIHRVLAADVAYTISRLQVLERLPGNPIGVVYRKVGDNVTALMARHIPSPSFNRVVGQRAGDERHIAPLAAWYREHGVTARFEMVPGDYDAALGRELAWQGYYQSGFHAALICRPGDAIAPTTALVERVTSAALMEDYLQAYMAGWGLPEKEHLQFKANVRPWLGQPGWSLYLARVDGRPAAAATLYVHGDLGYCADAATDPAFRRHGLQLALLHRRIADARAAGVDFVFSGAAFLSASHRNMERIGMRILFVRAIWTPLPEAQ